MENKSRKIKKRKVNIKRLSLILVILLVIIAVFIGILNLLIKAFSPEKVFGNYSNNNAGLAVSSGGTVYYNI